MSYNNWFDFQAVYLDVEKDIKYDLNVDVKLDYEIDLKIDKNIDIEVDLKSDVKLDDMFADGTLYIQNVSSHDWSTGTIQAVTGNIGNDDGDQWGSQVVGATSSGYHLPYLNANFEPLVVTTNSATGAAIALGKDSYAELDITNNTYDAGSSITIHAVSATDYSYYG
jgi:hypothetical protein